MTASTILVSTVLVTNGARGRAILRLDGFISADAAYTRGELITKPLVFAGDRLMLNVDTKLYSFQFASSAGPC